jgi:PAS domain S-box-containing protein
MEHDAAWQLPDDQARHERDLFEDREMIHVARGPRERGFLEAALDCVILADSSGRVVEFNPSAERPFGYTRAEALGRKLHELVIPPSLRAQHLQAFARFVDTHEERLFGRRVELTAMRADGSEFPIELALSQVEEEPLLIYGAVRDISHEKRAAEDLRRLADEQAVLRRVATVVAQGAGPTEVFAVVAEGVASVLGVPGINMIRFDQGTTATKIAGWGTGPFAVGSQWNLEDPSVMTSVVQTGRPTRIDDYTKVPGSFAKLARASGMASAVGAPIVVDGVTWGVIIAFSDGPEPFSGDAEDRLTSFTELVATAVANATARSELIASRARIVVAADEARRRIQRDIHDGAQQRLVASVIDLQLAEERFESDPAAARTRLRAALKSAQAGLEDLRELAAGLHPRILTIGGLKAALEDLGTRCGLPVVVHASERRYAKQVEAAAYFIVAEALANVAKHAHASRAEVKVEEQHRQLEIAVNDDGVGGADPDGGSGLRGLEDRIEALGGRFLIQSTKGTGTTLLACLPLDVS